MPIKSTGEFGLGLETPEAELGSSFNALSIGSDFQDGIVTVTSEMTTPGPLLSSTAPGLLLKPKPLVKEVNLMLSVERPEQCSPNTGPRQYHTETIHAFAMETIQNLRLRLKNRGLFTGHHYLVFGDRELMEHETVGQVAMESGKSDYLHVIARLSDVGTLEVTTKDRTVVLDNQHQDSPHLPKSTLSQGLALPENQEDHSLMLRGRVVGYSDTVTEIADKSVIHLLIRKSTKVQWNHVKDDWFEVSINAMDTVVSIKRKIEQVSSVVTDRCKFLCDGQILTASLPLASYGIGKGSVLELVPFETPRLRRLPDGSPKLSNPSHKLFQHWKAAKDALAMGVAPKLAPAGTGGSYFIFANDGTKVAVFKPEDEEPNGPNNPKGYAGSPNSSGLRKGVRPGEGATREIMAYLLDHSGFSGVPPTAMVSLKGMDGGAEKVGSFQQFIPHDMDCEEMGPSVFPTHEVHKIAVLDIRLANTDRNAGNILARRNLEDNTWLLTPIDHGYCAPSTFQDLNFEWVNWPQAKIPFTEVTRDYIEALDFERDMLILAEEGLSLRKECERVCKVCTLLLKKAAKKGLNLYQIGSIMMRQTFQKSLLEKMHKRATQLAIQEEYGGEPTGVQATWVCSDAVYMKHMKSVIDMYLDEMQAEDDNHDDILF